MNVWVWQQAADNAARAAGTVYRVVAGTQSLGVGLSASRDVGPAPAPMMQASAPSGAAPPSATMTMPGGIMSAAMPGIPEWPGFPGPNGSDLMPPVGRRLQLDSNSITHLISFMPLVSKIACPHCSCFFLSIKASDPLLILISN